MTDDVSTIIPVKFRFIKDAEGSIVIRKTVCEVFLGNIPIRYWGGHFAIEHVRHINDSYHINLLYNADIILRRFVSGENKIHCFYERIKYRLFEKGDNLCLAALLHILAGANWNEEVEL